MTKKRQLDRVDLLGFPEHGSVPYVTKFLAERGYSIMPDCSITKNGKTVPVSEIVVDLHQTYFQDQCLYVKRLRREGDTSGQPRPFKDKILEGGLDLVIFAERDRHLSDTVTRTEFSPSVDDTELRRFVKAVAAKGEPEELIVAVMKHWLGNIKKRMRGQAVAYHIFPVLVGKQGGGKTTALQMLLKPVRWYTMNLSSVLTLSDERNFKAISEKYVAILDEMARADKTDAQILKSLITAENLSARALGTNRRDRIIANCSYVGTANMSVRSLIYDPSGMRRFFELRCADELKWDEVNSIDYDKVWQCVSTEEQYLAPVRAALMEHQEQIRDQSQVEVFVQDEGIFPGEDGNEAHRVPNTSLYSLYTAWASRSGIRNTLDSRTLAKQLGDMGYQEWRSSRQRGRWVRVEGASERPGTYAQRGLQELEDEGAGPLVPSNAKARATN